MIIKNMKKLWTCSLFTLLVILLSGCETFATVNPGREVPKEKTIIYVQSDMDDTFGPDTALYAQTIIRAHDIDTEIINDFDDIPTYEMLVFGGTCFSISPHYIITNADNIANEVSQIYISGESYEAYLDYMNLDLNLAVLYVPDYEFLYSFDLQNSNEYTVAENIMAIGYPMGGLESIQPSVTQGIINSRTGKEGFSGQIEMSVPIQFMGIGGPLLREDDLSTVIAISTGFNSDIKTQFNQYEQEKSATFRYASKPVALISLYPKVVEYDKQTNPLPSTYEEAFQATAVILSGYEQENPYEKRLLLSANTNIRRTLNIGSYYSYYSYSCDVSLRLFDIDTELIDSTANGTYQGFSESKIPIALALEDYITEVYDEEYIVFNTRN